MYGGEGSAGAADNQAGHEGDGSFTVANDPAGRQQPSHHHGPEEASLHAANHGSRGTDFGIHRLLPPPLAFTTQPLQQQGSSHTIDHSAGGDSTGHVEMPGGHHAMPQGSYPIEPQRWVGYGHGYQYTPIPNYPGLEARRLPQTHTYPPYPMPPSYVTTTQPLPFPDPPGTPSHHHDPAGATAAVTSPVEPTPQPPNTMHLYHPANAGLYTLCQAAMMTSSNPETESYSSYQPPPLDQPSSSLGITHPPRPPPPYLHYYPPPLPFSGDPLQPQTSPDSPPPPAYPVHIEQPQAMCPEPHAGPSFMSNHLPPSVAVHSSEQDCDPAYVRPPTQHETEQSVAGEGAVFVSQGLPTTTAGLVQGTEHQDQATYSMNQSIAPTERDGALEDTEEPEPSATFMDHLPNISSAIVQDGEQPGPSYLQLPANHALQEFVEDQQQVDESDLVILQEPPSPDDPPLGQPRRPKRTRTAFSQAQQDKLELAYHANPYPDSFYRQKVAVDIGVPDDRIQVWFQNRRARGKKQARTGSVSQRSKTREQRLKMHLANLARQAALLSMAQRFGMAVQSGHHQQQLQQAEPSASNGGELPTTVSTPTTSQSVPSMPFTSSAIHQPPPAYNYTVGSATICYYPPPGPSTGAQHTTPAPNYGTEGQLQPPAGNTTTASMYLFPPPPGPLHPHSPVPMPTFPNPPIPQILHPYPPAPPFPHPSAPSHPTSLLPHSTSVSNSGSSSSPSPNEVISPQLITGTSDHSSTGPTQSSISPDQE